MAKKEKEVDICHTLSLIEPNPKIIRSVLLQFNNAIDPYQGIQNKEANPNNQISKYNNGNKEKLSVG